MANKPKILVIVTAVLGIVAALFFAIARYHESLKAAAEAERARLETTKSKHDFEAYLKSARKDSLATRFGKGSLWKGTHTLGSKEYPARLEITAREGEIIHGKLCWNYAGGDPDITPEVITAFEGRISEDTIAFELKKVEKGLGVYFPVSYAGRVSGETMSGNWTFAGPIGLTKGGFAYTLAKRPTG